VKTAGSYAPNKTNERTGRPGDELEGKATRAQARYVRMSSSKVRVVLDLIRGETVQRAGEILQYTERDAAEVVGKCLASAVANAVNNDGQSVGDLYVLACYADEGPTLKRWRPRARGRATRIRKRTTHVTIVVARLPEDKLVVVRAREASRSTARSGRTTRTAAEARRRRVAGSRGDAAAPPTGVAETSADEPDATDEAASTASAETESTLVEPTTAEETPDAPTVDDIAETDDLGADAEGGAEDHDAADDAPADDTEADTPAPTKDEEA
jgi:large subunit ribosomal protein L22